MVTSIISSISGLILRHQYKTFGGSLSLRKALSENVYESGNLSSNNSPVKKCKRDAPWKVMIC